MLAKLCRLCALCSPSIYDHPDILEHMHAADEYQLTEYIDIPRELNDLATQSIITAEQIARAQATAQTHRVFCQLHDLPYVVLYALNGRNFVGQLRCRMGSGFYYISLLETMAENRARGIANMLLLDAYALTHYHARTHGYPSVMIHWSALAMDEEHGLTQEQLVTFYQKRGARIVVEPVHMQVQFVVK